MKMIVTAPMVSHLKDHLAFWYLNEVYNLSSRAAEIDSEKLIDDEDEDVVKAYDGLMLASTEHVVESMLNTSSMAELPQTIQQLVQMVQQMSQGQQAHDPKAQAQMAETQRKTAADQQQAQLDTQRIQQEQARMQQDQRQHAEKVQLEQEQMQAEAQINEAELRARAIEKLRDNEAEMRQELVRQDADTARNTEDNDTKFEINERDNNVALSIAEMEVISGEKVALKNGNSIGE